MAQAEWGRCLINGDGVEKNPEKAIFYLESAAEQNNHEAMRMLGDIYYFGSGVSVDYAAAFNWYQNAVNDPEKADDIAECMIGDCYYNGNGVEKDDNQAFLWYQKAAEKDNPDAQYKLGNCYYHGDGVEVDKEKAFHWYEAASFDNIEAKYMLGECYYYGEGVEENTTQAFLQYLHAGEQGNANAQYSVGFCYENGIGCLENEDKALEWYRKAAENPDSHAKACFRIAELLYGAVNSARKTVKKTAINIPFLSNKRKRIELNNIADSLEESVVRYYKKAASLGHDKAREILEMRYGIQDYDN